MKNIAVKDWEIGDVVTFADKYGNDWKITDLREYPTTRGYTARYVGNDPFFSGRTDSGMLFSASFYPVTRPDPMLFGDSATATFDHGDGAHERRPHPDCDWCQGKSV